MTTRTEYAIRVDWGDGRKPFIPEVTTTPEEAEYRAKAWRGYPGATAEVIERQVTVGDWQPIAHLEPPC